MLAEAIADRCAEESGSSRLSKHSKEVSLIAIATLQSNLPLWKRDIRARFRQRNPEYGSVLLLILLPIIINLITTWLSRWIFSELPASMDLLQEEAELALKSL
jgi:hypothetical protein